MKSSTRTVLFFTLLFIGVFLFHSSAYSQGCSQCRLVPQSDQQGGGTAAAGINKAILYMMALPYIILFLLFRKQIVGFYRQFRAKR